MVPPASSRPKVWQILELRESALPDDPENAEYVVEEITGEADHETEGPKFLLKEVPDEYLLSPKQGPAPEHLNDADSDEDGEEGSGDGLGMVDRIYMKIKGIPPVITVVNCSNEKIWVVVTDSRPHRILTALQVGGGMPGVANAGYDSQLYWKSVESLLEAGEEENYDLKQVSMQYGRVTLYREGKRIEDNIILQNYVDYGRKCYYRGGKLRLSPPAASQP